MKFLLTKLNKVEKLIFVFTAILIFTTSLFLTNSVSTFALTKDIFSVEMGFKNYVPINKALDLLTNISDADYPQLKFSSYTKIGRVELPVVFDVASRNKTEILNAYNQATTNTIKFYKDKRVRLENNKLELADINDISLQGIIRNLTLTDFDQAETIKFDDLKVNKLGLITKYVDQNFANLAKNKPKVISQAKALSLPAIVESNDDKQETKDINTKIKILQSNYQTFQFKQNQSKVSSETGIASSIQYTEITNLTKTISQKGLDIQKEKSKLQTQSRDSVLDKGCPGCTPEEQKNYNSTKDSNSLKDKIVGYLNSAFGGVSAKAEGLNNGDGLVIYSNVNSDYALDLANGSMANGTRLDLWFRRPANFEPGYDSQQKQTFYFNDSDNSIRMKINGVTKCVDVSNNQRTRGAAIQIWDCNNTNAQKWLFGDNRIKIVKNNWSEPEYCINSPQGLTTSPYSELTLYECNGYGTNFYQSWVVGKNTDFNEQYYNVIFSDGRSQCTSSYVTNVGCHSWMAIYNQFVTPKNSFGLWSQQTDNDNSNINGKSNNIKTGNNIQVDGGSGQQNVDDFLFSQNAFNSNYSNKINVSGVKYRAEYIDKKTADRLRYMNYFQAGGSTSSDPGWYKQYDIFGGKQCSTYAFTLWNYTMDSNSDLSMTPFVPITPSTLAAILPNTTP